MPEHVPAEVFPPGEFIKDELEARGWTQTDLAEILGRPPRLVSEVISGKRSISPETAQGLAAAFSTDAQLWLNLDSAYQLSRTRQPSDVVARRASLYGSVPVKEMLRRHWLEATDSIDVLEERVKSFLGVHSLSQPMLFAAARRSPLEELSPAQRVWLVRCKQMAQMAPAVGFKRSALNQAEGKLRTLLREAHEVRHVPGILAEAGIRFVVVEAFPGSRIDGACFWLDNKSPTVALSLRFDRIDAFWFTLLHELAHIRAGDGKTEEHLDVDLVGKDSRDQKGKAKAEQERRANSFASDFLVPSRGLNEFIARVRPIYSRAKIQEFAALNHVHPGIVVGRLQHMGEIPYAHSREMLEKVRDKLIPATFTDGFGSFVSASQKTR
jgi:HTH-type transcriptional regulator/antitoxin HigA